MTEALDAKVVAFVEQVCTAMGIPVEVTLEETPDHVRVNLAGAPAEALLRRKGEALDALQVVVNTAFRRDARGDRHYVVDALGYRRGKDVELQQMGPFLIGKSTADGATQGHP